MADDRIVFAVEVDDKGSLQLKKVSDSMEAVRAKANQIKTGLADMKDSWERVAVKAAAGAAAFYGIVRAATAVVDVVKKVSSELNDIERSAGVMGMTTTRFQELQYVAKMADLEVGSLTQGFKFLSKSIVEAEQGTGDASRIFQAMGINVKDAAGKTKSLDDVMGEIADKFAPWEDGPRKIAIALALFGRAGESMIPLLNKGSEGFASLSKEAHALGAIIDEDLIKKGSQVEDEFKKVDAVIKALKASLVMAIVPTNDFGTALANMIKQARDFYSNPYVQAAFKMIGAMPGFGLLKGLSIGAEAMAPTPEGAPEFAVSHGAEYMGDKAGTQPPPIGGDTEKFKTEGLYRSLMELNRLREEAAAITAKYVEIQTDEIIGYDQLRDSLGKVIGLQARYKNELIPIEDLLKREKEFEDNWKSAQTRIMEGEQQLAQDIIEAWTYVDEGKLVQDMDYIDKNNRANELILEGEKQLAQEIIDAWGWVYETQKENDMKIHEQMQKTQEFWAGTVEEMLGSSLNIFFGSAVTGFKNIGDAAKQWGQDMINIVQKVIQNFLLFGSLTGGKGGTSFFGTSGGLGGLVGGIMSLLKLSEGGVIPGGFLPIQAFAGGGIARRPTLGLIGEAGEDEAVVPLRGGKIPIEGSGGQTIIIINANDAKSFDDMVRRNPGSIIGAVSKNTRLNGPMRNVIRGAL